MNRDTPHGIEGTARSDVRWALVVFAGALAFLLSLDPFNRPLLFDPATWDYMSVEFARGMVPYRDIFLHKTPGAAILGSLGVRVATLLGVTPVFGAHGLFLLFGAMGAALLFLLCRRTLPLAAALAASALLMGFDQWPLATVEGVRPKIATTMLGLASLLAADRGRYGLSGLLAGASSTCWQPGACYAVGALWTLLKQERARSARPLARLAAGAAVPPLVLVAWLSAHDALEPFFAQALGFNVHYVELMAKTPAETVAKIMREMMHLDRMEMLLLPVALIGVALAPRRIPQSVLLSGCVYLAMTFGSFQAWPDTILFGPPVAAALAAGLYALLSRITAPATAGGLMLALGIASAAFPSAARLAPPITFEEQAKFMHELAPELSASDSVVAVSLPEFLIHTGRRSRWPWPYMWFGVDRFAAQHTPGGFDAILGDLERDPPRLILVARRWAGPLRKRFAAWAAARYDRTITRIYPHTTRPIIVYRLRER